VPAKPPAPRPPLPTERSASSRHDRLDAAAVALITLLCALWGVQQVAVKVAVSGGLPPLLQGTLRSAVAALLLAATIAARGGTAALGALFRRDGATGPGLLIAALFAGEFLMLYPGLALTTASRGVLFLYTAPFFTAAGVHLLLPAERLRTLQAGGLLVAFAGVAAAFAEGLGSPGCSLRGDLLCLAAGAFWGITTVVVKASPGLIKANASRLLLYQLAGSVPLMLAASLIADEHAAWNAVSGLAWAALFYQTVIVAFASYLAWFMMIQRYPAGRLAGFTFLTPLFGILAGVTFLGEAASPTLILGVAAIAAGLRMVNSRGHR
jgi:drug/metabolite transporter (DMT)-like permease